MIKGKSIFLPSLWLSLCFLCIYFVPPGLLSSQQAPPGPLNRVHGELRGGKNCIKCHTSSGEVGPSRCLECHRELAARIKAGKGYHRDKGEACADCHQEHQEEGAPLIQWEPQNFDHSETGYILDGAHRKVRECSRCHRPDKTPSRQRSRSFLLKDSRCSACHRDAHRGNYPQCTDCHQTTEWRVDIW